MTCYGCGERLENPGHKCKGCGYDNRSPVKDSKCDDIGGCGGCGGCGVKSNGKSCAPDCRAGGEVTEEEPDDEDPYHWEDPHYWWDTSCVSLRNLLRC